MNDFKMGGQRPITFDRFIRGCITLIIIAGLGALIYYLNGVLMPFFVAWVVAYLLYPLVRILHKCLRSRILAIFLALLLAVGVIGGFVYLVIPPMVSEMGHLKDVALTYIRKGADTTVIPISVQEFLRKHLNETQVEQFLQNEDVVTAIKNTVPRVWELLWSTAGVIVNFAASLIGLLYLLFILTDYEKYANSWITFVPHSKRAFAARLIADVEEGMAGYFRGQALIALSNCVMFSIGFFIIGFPLPVALGCLIGVISFVPYLQVLGILPAALLALLKAVESGQNFWWLLGLVIIVYIVVQILQDTIFTPRIMGHIMGLPPAIILLSLSVWGYAFGIVGLILALPVTTLAISYYKRYVVGEKDLTDNSPNPAAVEVEKNMGIYVEEPVPAHESAASAPQDLEENTAANNAPAKNPAGKDKAEE